MILYISFRVLKRQFQLNAFFPLIIDLFILDHKKLQETTPWHKVPEYFKTPEIIDIAHSNITLRLQREVTKSSIQVDLQNGGNSDNPKYIHSDNHLYYRRIVLANRAPK